MKPTPFPSDRYAVESHLKWHGYDPKDALLTLQPRPGEATVRQADIDALLRRDGESIALIWLGGVNYYTGQVFDMAAITASGHAQGCAVGFDLAHAAGNIALALHDWDIDCAVWCSYKYLNAGPGSVAGCFVHERYANRPDLPRLAGWWGHNKDTRFHMPTDFDPIPGAEGWANQQSAHLSARRPQGGDGHFRPRWHGGAQSQKRALNRLSRSPAATPRSAWDPHHYARGASAARRPVVLAD